MTTPPVIAAIARFIFSDSIKIITVIKQKVNIMELVVIKIGILRKKELFYLLVLSNTFRLLEFHLVIYYLI